MFTGLIQKMGRFVGFEWTGGGATIGVALVTPWNDPVARGESIAVQGVCLTVTDYDAVGFRCDVLEETLTRTSLGERKHGDLLNLERALAVGDRLGGHIVQGHVDGTGVVESVRTSGRDHVIRIACESSLARDILLKGSVALDGVSLTATAVSPGSFEVNVIPVTWQETSLQSLMGGMRVNVETDVIGKYVRRYLEGREGAGGVTMDGLRRAGIE